MNVGADAISRNNLNLLFSQVPEATRHPTAIPEALVDLVIRQQPDWSQLFKACLLQVLPPARKGYMDQGPVDMKNFAPLQSFQQIQ